MAKKISTDGRRELVQAISERYRASASDEKARILDEFVAVTGYHRKHSIRLLNAIAAAATTARTPRLRLYDEAEREVLIVLWEAADRICGKRLTSRRCASQVRHAGAAVDSAAAAADRSGGVLGRCARDHRA